MKNLPLNVVSNSSYSYHTKRIKILPLKTWQNNKNWLGERKDVGTPNSRRGSPGMDFFHSPHNLRL